MKLICWLFRKQLEKARTEGYEEGITRGYNFGLIQRNRIIKDKYHSEIEEIVKESGF